MQQVNILIIPHHLLPRSLKDENEIHNADVVLLKRKHGKYDVMKDKFNRDFKQINEEQIAFYKSSEHHILKVMGES